MTRSIISPNSGYQRSMSLSPADFDCVRLLVQGRSAIVLDDEKRYLAETRLDALARREGFDSLDQLVAGLRDKQNDALCRKVVEAMTTNETSFFRDVQPFDAIRNTLLPEIIQQRRHDRSVRIWCAGCSTGQEPYSLAMLLREHFPLLSGWDVQIIGSDLSTEVLERAREGRFSQFEVNRGLPARLFVRFFTKKGNDWLLNEDVRRLVDFREINLIGDWPTMPDFDLVLLRNVLIYFDLLTKRRVLQRVRRLLKPWSALILGGAETTLNIDDAYERVQPEKAAWYRLVRH